MNLNSFGTDKLFIIKLALVSILIFVLASCSNDSKNEIDGNQSYYIKNNIINGFFLNSKTTYSASGEILDTSSFSYDSDRNTITEEIHNTSTVETTQLDSRGHIVKIEFESDGLNPITLQFENGPDGRPLSSTIFVTEQFVQTNLINSVFRYNDDGSLDALTNYDEAGAIVNFVTYRYDDGRLEGATNTDGSGSIVSFIYFDYDDQGYIMEKAWDYDATGQVDLRIDFTTDEFGNITETIEYSGLGELLERTTFSYIPSEELVPNLIEYLETIFPELQ